MSRCTILLENMEFRAFHGCYDLEKVVGSRFVATLEVEAEVGDAAQRDSIADTLNYLSLYEIVEREMAIPSDLIENVAHRIAASVRESFPQVIAARVSLSKIAPPLGGKVDRVTVRLER